MRKLYLDNIRWMTVVLVVIYHVIYMFNSVQPYGVIGPFKSVQFQDAFQYFVYPWFMSLLFVISGMSAKYYLDSHDTKQFIKDKTRKLLVPSTIGLFVFQWILGYYNMAIGGGELGLANLPKPIYFLIMAISGTGVLWYIQMLWIFSMLLIIVRKIEKNRLLTLGKKTPAWLIFSFVLLVYGFAQILNTPVITVYRFGIYGFVFFVGYFVFSHEEVMDRLQKYYVSLDLVAILFGVFYTAFYFGENYAAEPVINNVAACFYCWFAILAILTTMREYGNFQNHFTQWMNKKSWGLYVFHYLPLAMTSFYLHKYIPNMPAIFVYVLVGTASFIGAYALNEIISRIPILRWCVLGIKGEKNV